MYIGYNVDYYVIDFEKEKNRFEGKYLEIVELRGYQNKGSWEVASS